MVETAPHWNATGEPKWKLIHTGMPLEKLYNFCSLHWDTTGGTVTAHTRPVHIIKQSSTHASLKWHDGGTPISKSTGLCKFSLYLEFTALQLLPFLFLNTCEYFSITLCKSLIYAPLLFLCIRGCSSACCEVTWPNDLQSRFCQYTRITLNRPYYNTTWATSTLGCHWNHIEVVSQWRSSVNLHDTNTL